MICPICVGIAGSTAWSMKSLADSLNVSEGVVIGTAIATPIFLYQIGLIPYLCANIKSSAYYFYDNFNNLSYDDANNKLLGADDNIDAAYY